MLQIKIFPQSMNDELDDQVNGWIAKNQKNVFIERISISGTVYEGYVVLVEYFTEQNDATQR